MFVAYVGSARDPDPDSSVEAFTRFVAMTGRIVADVAVQICIAAGEINRILRRESLKRRAVVSGAVEVESGGIVFTAGDITWKVTNLFGSQSQRREPAGTVSEERVLRKTAWGARLLFLLNSVHLLYECVRIVGGNHDSANKASLLANQDTRAPKSIAELKCTGWFPEFDRRSFFYLSNIRNPNYH